MSTANLPLRHFQYLKRLAVLRRTDIPETLTFLMSHVDDESENWIDAKFGTSAETRTINLCGYDRGSIMRKIQGLPRDIRPVTDGPYLEKFNFFSSGDSCLGIEAEGVKIVDFDIWTPRDKEVYALVRDRLPGLSLSQYRLYNTFNSQFLRLVKEPKLFSMPSSPFPAIDAGAYAGYKALAMSKFVQGAPVLAFELAPEAFELLRRNSANNPKANLQPVQAALSDTPQDQPVYCLNPQSMAFSLTDFGQLNEKNLNLAKDTYRFDSRHKAGSGDIANLNRQEFRVKTSSLDEYTKRIDRISALHISVNGHEPEVVLGGLETARKSDIIRISCPYKRGDFLVRDIVKSCLEENNVKVFGRSGGAVIAGSKLNDYHCIEF